MFFFLLRGAKRDPSRLKTHSAASLFHARVYVNRHVLRRANSNGEKKSRYRPMDINTMLDILQFY